MYAGKKMNRKAEGWGGGNKMHNICLRLNQDPVNLNLGPNP